MTKLKLYIVVVSLVVVSVSQSLAADISDYKFLKVSPQDQRGVVQTPDGQLQLISVGDVIADDAEIVEIAEERIVLAVRNEDKPEKVIVRLNGNRQRIERYSQVSEPEPVYEQASSIPMTEAESGMPSLTAPSVQEKK